MKDFAGLAQFEKILKTPVKNKAISCQLQSWERLTDIIGQEAASKVQDEFKGEVIRVPVKKVQAGALAENIKKDFASGLTIDEIVKKYSVSRQTALRYVKKIKEKIMHRRGAESAEERIE